jgi:YjbE family integral membrane protein
MEQIATAVFWVALGKITWVNILLSGDKAAVIAMAARGLPTHQRGKAIFAGSAAAIVLRVLRVLLTVFAVQLLQYPYLKVGGALALLWIGVQLLVPEDDDGGGIRASDHLWAAVRTILIADLVMSVDNVLAVAAAADSGPPESRLALLIIGLGLSIPLIIFGSQLLLGVMERYPVIITLGAALLGYVAGEMIVGDRATEAFFQQAGRGVRIAIETAAAVAVVLVGQWLARRKQRTPAHEAATPIGS